jgi:hypothetical protein
MLSGFFHGEMLARAELAMVLFLTSRVLASNYHARDTSWWRNRLDPQMRTALRQIVVSRLTLGVFQIGTAWSNNSLGCQRMTGVFVTDDKTHSLSLKIVMSGTM